MATRTEKLDQQHRKSGPRKRACSICCLVLAVGSAVSCVAQQPAPNETHAPERPITVETLFGNDRLDLQVLIHSTFAPGSRADFLSVTSSQGQGNNTTQGFDFVNVTHVGFDLYKGFGVNLGLALNRVTGFNTTAGLQYGFSKHAITAVVSPAVFLNGNHDIQNVLVTNYRPQLAKNWRLYEAVTVLDEFDPQENLDARKFVHARSGAQYKRFGFAFGCDFDWYGQPKSFRTNYGPALAYNF